MKTSLARLPRKSAHGTNGSNATETGLAGLDSECLAHHWASAGNLLEIGHSATAGRCLRASRGRQSPEGCGACFLEEWAHALGGSNGLHCDGLTVSDDDIEGIRSVVWARVGEGVGIQVAGCSQIYVDKSKAEVGSSGHFLLFLR